MLAVVALVLAVPLAVSTPFTTGAEIATAVAFAAMAVVAVATARRRAVWSDSAPGPTPRPDPAPEPAPRPRAGRVWAVWAGLVVALELSTYLAGISGGRQDYPTLSSLIDEVTRSDWTRGLLALAWLALGWGLFGS